MTLILLLLRLLMLMLCLHRQVELSQLQEEAASLRASRGEVAALQVQLAAAQEEAAGLRNSSEEMEYLQAQLRRTLRQVVELQHQVRARVHARVCACVQMLLHPLHLGMCVRVASARARPISACLLCAAGAGRCARRCRCCRRRAAMRRPLMCTRRQRTRPSTPNTSSSCRCAGGGVVGGVRLRLLAAAGVAAHAPRLARAVVTDLCVRLAAAWRRSSWRPSWSWRS